MPHAHPCWKFSQIVLCSSGLTPRGSIVLRGVAQSEMSNIHSSLWQRQYQRNSIYNARITIREPIATEPLRGHRVSELIGSSGGYQDYSHTGRTAPGQEPPTPLYLHAILARTLGKTENTLSARARHNRAICCHPSPPQSTTSYAAKVLGLALMP